MVPVPVDPAGIIIRASSAHQRMVNVTNREIRRVRRRPTPSHDTDAPFTVCGVGEFSKKETRASDIRSSLRVRLLPLFDPFSSCSPQYTAVTFEPNCSTIPRQLRGVWTYTRARAQKKNRDAVRTAACSWLRGEPPRIDVGNDEFGGRGQRTQKVKKKKIYIYTFAQYAYIYFLQ